MLGFGKLTGSFVPPTFDFALPIEPAAFDPKRAKQLLTEAGYPNGFDAGDLTPLPPYSSVAEAIGGNLQAIGIRSRVRTSPVTAPSCVLLSMSVIRRLPLGSSHIGARRRPGYGLSPGAGTAFPPPKTPC